MNGINVDSRAVDLGLSVYWAKYNLGAIDSTSQGSFIYGYAINGTWTDSSWPNWRIPKKIEIDELRSNTNFSNGFFTSNNSNSIRVPMMHYEMGGPNGAPSISDGWMFWSCSFDNYCGWPVYDSIDAYVLRYKNTVQTTTLNRANGLPIRFVIDKVTITLKSGNTTISKSFPKGSTIQIGVYRDDCHTFLHWIKDNDTAHPLPMANPFEIFADVTYEAVFVKKQYKITTAVGLNGGGSVTRGGTYFCGDTIKLTAQSKGCYQFDKWSDGVKDSVRTIVVDGDINLIANFSKKTYLVTTNSNDTTLGRVSPDSTSVSCGDSVVLIAAPNNSCMKFKGWYANGDLETQVYDTIHSNDGFYKSVKDKNGNYKLTIYNVADTLRLVAVFKKDSFNVTAATNNINYGYVTDPSHPKRENNSYKTTIECGKSDTLLAVHRNDCIIFEKWVDTFVTPNVFYKPGDNTPDYKCITNDTARIDTLIIYNVDRPFVLEAVFKMQNHQISAEVSPERSGEVQINEGNDVGNIYDCDKPITLTATPTDCYMFNRWTKKVVNNLGNIEEIPVEGESQITISPVTEDATYVAYFIENKVDVTIISEDRNKGTVAFDDGNNEDDNQQE